MYKRMGVKKLGRTRSHRDSLIKNQLRTLFESGILRTTTPKAKVIKSKAEALLSSMGKGEVSLITRRKLLIALGNSTLVGKSLEYAKKSVTGVRVVKIGFRSGDNAQVGRVELIGFKTKKAVKKVEEKEGDKKKVAPVKEVNKGIEKRNVEKKLDKKVARVQKERARTRSGL